MLSNVEAIREYRASLDAAEGVALGQALADIVKGAHVRGEITSEAACEAWEYLEAIRVKAGEDPVPHQRRAKRQRDELVARNIGLVKRVAKRTLGARAGNPANLEEAVNEGAMGLVRAIDCFDEKRGAFSTCAGFWIRHYVQNCMQKQGDFVKQRPACMPASIAKRVNRFRLEHGREPAPEEIEVDPKDWARWLDTTIVLSVDDMTAVGEEPGEVLADETTNAETFERERDFREKLEATLAKMSPRNREILGYVFLEGHEINEAAEHFDLAVQRVYKLKTMLEKRLRRVLAA